MHANSQLELIRGAYMCYLKLPCLFTILLSLNFLIRTVLQTGLFS